MRQTNHKISNRSGSGFSLVEMMIVVVIIGIIAGMAMYSIVGALPNIKVNNGLNVALGALKNAKYLAVSQRREYQLVLTPPQQMQISRTSISAFDVSTAVPAISLPGEVQFILFPGVPDTPDGYGAGGAIDFGGTPTLRFLSDQEFVDAAGAPLNGSIYIGIPGNSATQRAITISGTTGRIRAYRWNGGSWLEY